MIKKSVIMVLNCSLVFSNAVLAQPSTNDEINQLVKFLTSKQLLIQSKDGVQVPLSYYIGDKTDVAKYFGDYVCKSDNTCSVTDSLYSNPYAILGRGLPPQQGTELEKAQAQAQLERTDMQYGADIYDAATWQIALAVTAKNGYIDKVTAQQLINNQSQRISNRNNRATAKEFKYGYETSISNPANAFAFRMVATDFQNKDPFYQSRYQDYVSWDYDPNELSKNDPQHHSPNFFKYVSTWSDWKPITGENAWAMLVGPIQAEYLLYDGKVPADSKALKMAIDSLYAFSAMQSGIGAFYYAPGGSQGNQGPIPDGEISLENNFSVLGGLQILKAVLKNTEQTSDIKNAEAMVDVMLNGGKTVNGHETIGLLSFLYNGAFNVNKGIFYTHGIAVTPSSQKDWQPDTSNDAAAQAIDVNTWGIASLGPETIDKWYGKGTALNIWKTIRTEGGYYNNGTLWGVGYTLQNHTGSNPENIMSTEWTAGAINAVTALIEYYGAQGEDISELQQDLTTMQQGIQHLRNDKYLSSNFDSATAKEYYVVVPENAGIAYLYASKRFAIPFGWNANTLASTTSNAWVIMNLLHYNPFQYGGSFKGQNYTTPAKIDITGGSNPPQGDALPKAVTANFNSGNLGPITQLSLSYNNDGSNENWISAATVSSPNGAPVKYLEGKASLPKGAKALSIAFNNGGWAGACQVHPASKICIDEECSQLKTIAVKWSANGQGDCDLVNP